MSHLSLIITTICMTVFIIGMIGIIVCFITEVHEVVILLIWTAMLITFILMVIATPSDSYNYPKVTTTTISQDYNYCPECGQELDSGQEYKYCPGCGNEIVQSER